MDRTITDTRDPSTGDRTINLTSSSRPSKVENKRHKRHTRLKALRHKAFRVWRFGRANATNATQTPPNATPMGSTAGHVAIVPLAGGRWDPLLPRLPHPAFCPQLGSCRPGGSPPPANTSGEQGHWRFPRRCWAKTGRCRLWRVCRRRRQGPRRAVCS